MMNWDKINQEEVDVTDDQDDSSLLSSSSPIDVVTINHHKI